MYPRGGEMSILIYPNRHDAGSYSGEVLLLDGRPLDQVVYGEHVQVFANGEAHNAVVDIEVPSVLGPLDVALRIMAEEGNYAFVRLCLVWKDLEYGWISKRNLRRANMGELATWRGSFVGGLPTLLLPKGEVG
jgi:hypothetical protein